MDLAQRWADVTVGEATLNHVLTVLGGFGTLYLFACIFYVIERIRPAVRAQKYFKTDFGNELCYVVFNAAITTPAFTLVSIGLSLWILEPYVPHHVFAEAVAGQPFVLQVLFVMLVADVAVYAEHWFAHRVLWNFHALHHMTSEVSWLTHARVHPVNAVTISAASVIAHFVFGVRGEAVAVGGGLALALAMWEHSNMDFAWPKPFCYLLVSPRFHRWHHSSDAAAIDKNFCLIFPFLDLLMGTYYCPDRMPTAYGVHRASADEPQIPATFGGQLWYPFARTLERIRVTGRQAEVVAPEAGEPRADIR